MAFDHVTLKATLSIFAPCTHTHDLSCPLCVLCTPNSTSVNSSAVAVSTFSTHPNLALLLLGHDFVDILAVGQGSAARSL